MTPARVALRRGLGAFAVVAVAGQLVPLAIDLFGGSLAFRTALPLGWFYALAFHRVGLDVTTGGAASQLSIAFLSGTALVLWLLYRAGRAAAAQAGPSIRERTVAGALVAPIYAVPIGLLSLVTHLDLRIGGDILAGAVRIQGVAWQAFVYPAVLAAVVGGAGGALSAETAGSRLRAWLVGGWRMLLLALGLALIGLLLLAAVRPQGLRTYVYVVSANGGRAAMLILGHQALLLPNHAFLVLAPSMGGCVSLEGPAATVPLLCPGRLPVLGSEVGPTIQAARNGGPAPLHGAMPAPYGLFILVPAAATIAGGRWAAGDAGRRERVIRSLGAGIVFGGLVGVGAWASGIAFRDFAFGPLPVPTGLLGLVWGTIGGTLGGLLPVGQDAPGALVPGVPEAPPPRPTSV